MSDPTGGLVLCARENSRDATNPAPEGSPEAWTRAPERVLARYPKIIDLTGDLEPDHDAGAIEIQDPVFIVLGDARLMATSNNRTIPMQRTSFPPIWRMAPKTCSTRARGVAIRLRCFCVSEIGLLALPLRWI
jgi:hypothetical protein